MIIQIINNDSNNDYLFSKHKLLKINLLMLQLFFIFKSSKISSLICSIFSWTGWACFLISLILFLIVSTYFEFGFDINDWIFAKSVLITITDFNCF